MSKSEIKYFKKYFFQEAKKRYVASDQRAIELLVSPRVSGNELAFGLSTEDGGRCLPAFAGRKLGEMCNRENQCDAGLVCEEVVPGKNQIK
jgi:hypothetical protein